MREMQASFSSGEISPLLHARVDLARYSTALAELKNMIVLPQGGVTRRGGMKQIIRTTSEKTRLIPFEYNATDAVILEFANKTLTVWGNISGECSALANISTPYSINDAQTLRYVQSGNVMFLAHRGYKPQMLTRQTLRNWTITELPYHGGPFISANEWGTDSVLYLSGYGDTRTIEGNIFNSALVGTLLKLEYAVPSRTQTFESSTTGTASSNFEVKGTLNVSTTGEWTGLITIERSSDGGATWVTIRQYKRTDKESQGQWDFTVSETEAYILYRVKAAHDDPATRTDKKGTEAATVTITASGFLKSEIYKITSIISDTKARIKRQKDLGFVIDDEFNGRVSLWSIGAWGDYQGYPGAVAMYQDRLVFASTDMQPQTIWLSKTGDYANFSISDPLADDDAVTITLAGSSADGIHSLVSSADLLAFTNSGEWQIRGAGDNGAITPSALTAHQQSNIGSKNIQPITANGKIIFVQSQGEKVFGLGYDLNIDGYSGSEMSILSAHIFEGKKIVSMAYQKVPDSLLWFVLDDGSFACCTYNPEHEVIGWSRHSSGYLLKSVCEIQGDTQTEIFAVAVYNGYQAIIRFKPRSDDSSITDNGAEFESMLRTLRVNINSEDGSLFTGKKLISRLNISVLNSVEAWVAPGDFIDDTKNWERRRKITWEKADYLTDAEIQLDNGFNEYASVQIRSIGDEPLTIAAITPSITA